MSCLSYSSTLGECRRSSPGKVNLIKHLILVLAFTQFIAYLAAQTLLTTLRYKMIQIWDVLCQDQPCDSYIAGMKWALQWHHHFTVCRIKRWTEEGLILNTILTLATYIFLIVYWDYSHENLLTGVKIFYQLPFLTTSLSSDHIIYKVSFCEILLNWMMLSSVAKQVI